MLMIALCSYEHEHFIETPRVFKAIVASTGSCHLIPATTTEGLTNTFSSPLSTCHRPGASVSVL